MKGRVMNTPTTKEVKPSFYDVCITHSFVDQMLCDEKVAKDDARAVLQTLSSQLGHSYTLENVAVKLSVRKVHRV